MTAITLPAGRGKYRPSGRIAVGRFLILLGCTGCVALIMSFLLAAAFWLGFYLIMIAVLIGAAPVAGMMFLTVKFGQCRNPALAAALGLLLGGSCYLGYYYFDMLRWFGPQVVHRIDALPQFIALRMSTDVVQDVGEVNDNVRENRGFDYIMNWLLFGAEFSVAAGMATATGYVLAKKPFDERRREWMSQATYPLALENWETVLTALQNRDAKLLNDKLVEPISMAQPYCELQVWFPNEDPIPSAVASLEQERARIAFLSVAEVGLAKKDSTIRPRRTLIQLWELAPDELSVLARRIPALGGEVVPVAAETTEAGVVARRLAPEDALVEDLEPPCRGQILNKKTIWTGVALVNAVSVVGLIGGFVVLGGGIVLSRMIGQKDNPWILVPTIVGAFALWGLAGIYEFLWGKRLGNRFMLRRLEDALSSRPNALAKSMDSETWFVDIVPRQNWGKMMLENAVDIGLLRIDPHRQMIFFEGDQQRWAIPAASIVNCELERHIQGEGGAGAQVHFFNVIRAQLDGRVWEVSLCPRSIERGWHGKARRERDAHRLQDALHTGFGIAPA